MDVAASDTVSDWVEMESAREKVLDDRDLWLC